MRRRAFLKLLAAAPAIVLTPGAVSGCQQRPSVPPMKSNDLPVYAHYMPWFATPATTPDGRWGWHWRMDRCNPDHVDPRTGRRDIAAHFYPLIGPYDSGDPDVLEYHLLLMKLSGIDGVLVDWYGASSRDEEARMLLRNADAVCGRAEALGLEFGVVLEERFADDVDDLRVDVGYLEERYLHRPAYVRTDAGPLLAIFGPRRFQPAQWEDILGSLRTDLDVRTLWHNDGAGKAADGYFLWPYQERPGDHLERMRRYYDEIEGTGARVLGVAYPGFKDFYAEGAIGARGYFTIDHRGGSTLDRVLGLVSRRRDAIEALQLATWNDFGEGTMFEPTVETGFDYLVRVQAFTGVSSSEEDLRSVHRLYVLRKGTAGDAAVGKRLDAIAHACANWRLADARRALDELDGGASRGSPLGD